MKIGFKANDVEFFVELNADEQYLFAVGVIKLFNELPLEEMFGDEAGSFIESILSVVNRETETETDEDPEEPEEEPEEEPAVKQEKTKIPCRTWNHYNEEAKYKFVKNWLRRRKIPFEEAGYSRTYITYELTLAQLERLQRSLKESFGEDFDTEIRI